MTKQKIQCYRCNSSFTFEYAHAGFGDEIFFYCNECGMVATVDLYGEEITKGEFYKKHNLLKPIHPHNEKELMLFEDNFKKMKIEISKNLNSCSCGGKFTIDAIPRCPICNKELEWDKIVDEIDKNSGRVTEPCFRKCLKKGWHDIYYFIFSNRMVKDSWESRKK